jgi:hypothetical protein
MTGEPTTPRRRLALQAAGFVLGLALLGWCISTAVQGGDWARLRHADPLLVAGLVGASLLSQVASVLIFWVSIRSTHPLPLAKLTWLNLAVSFLNYAPVRIGLAARVAYHLRVDRMSLLLIGGWLAALTLTLAAGIGSVVGATLLRPRLDWIWAGVMLVFVVSSGLSLRAAASMPLISRRARGADQMLRQPLALWGSITLRLVDLLAYALRIGVAAALLGHDFTPDQILLLAVATLVVGMNPLGRVGFREATVAFVASRMAESEATVEPIFTQLALIDSASEAIVVVPLGAVAMVWFMRQWRSAGRASTTPSSS